MMESQRCMITQISVRKQSVVILMFVAPEQVVYKL